MKYLLTIIITLYLIGSLIALKTQDYDLMMSNICVVLMAAGWLIEILKKRPE